MVRETLGLIVKLMKVDNTGLLSVFLSALRMELRMLISKEIT